MEDSLEKLKLMKQCDFSMHSGTFPRYSGLGNAILGLSSSANLFARIKKSPEPRTSFYEHERELVFTMFNAYGHISISYASIPFEKLDPEDEDFIPLFTIRNILPDLGKAINDLITYPVLNQEFGDISSSEPYQKVNNFCLEFDKSNTPQYRSRIKDLEERLKKNGLLRDLKCN